MAIFSESRRRALIEASYEADAKARAEANRIWDSIETYLNSLSPLELKGLPSTTSARGTQAFQVPSGKTEIPKGLRVVLTADPSSKFVPGSNTIYVGKVLKAPGDVSEMDLGLATGRKGFVHEFIHYLDYGRRKDSGKGADIQQAMQGGRTMDLPRYMQTPMEFNAWYQMLASEIERSVDAMLRSIAKGGRAGAMLRPRLTQTFSSPEKFLAYIIRDVGDAVAIRALKGSKWERKWDKRVAQLYAELKAKVDAALAIGGVG